MTRNTQAGRPKRHSEAVGARIGQRHDRDEVDTSAPFADVRGVPIACAVLVLRALLS